MRQNIKNRKKIAIFVMFLGLLVAAILFARATLVYEISCRNQFGECSSGVMGFLDGLKGSNYFHFKSNAASALKDKYSAENVRFSYVPFNKVKVFVLEQTPDFAISSDLQNYALVDKSGKVLSVQSATALPLLIKKDSNFTPGMDIEQSMVNALKILEYFYYTFNTKQVEMENGYVKAPIENGISVYISSASDIQLEIGKLVFILSRLKAGGEENTISYENIQEIDLRYKSPILR